MVVVSWTATLLAGQSHTGRRIFIEPERIEITERLDHYFVPQACVIRGINRVLVKSERFRGNYVLTYRQSFLEPKK